MCERTRLLCSIAVQTLLLILTFYNHTDIDYLLDFMLLYVNCPDVADAYNVTNVGLYMRAYLLIHSLILFRLSSSKISCKSCYNRTGQQGTTVHLALPSNFTDILVTTEPKVTKKFNSIRLTPASELKSAMNSIHID